MALRYKFVPNCRFENYREDVLDITEQMVISGSLERGKWSLRLGYTANLSIPRIVDSLPFTSTAYTNVGYTPNVNETWQESPLRGLPYVDVSTVGMSDTKALFRLEFTGLDEKKRYLTFFWRTTGSLYATATFYNSEVVDLTVNTTNATYMIGSISANLPSTRTVHHILPYQFEYQEKNYLGFMTISYNGLTDDSLSMHKFGAICIDDFIDYFGSVTEKPEYNLPEESTTGGYDGLYDDSSDIISIPNQPTLSVSSMGLINIYKPSVDGLMGFVNELFPDIDFPEISGGFDLEAVVDALQGVCETIVNGTKIMMNEKLLDYVLDVHLLPVNPSAPGTEQIHVGYKQSSVTAPKVTSDYVDFYCGELNISEYYGNFLDYEGTMAQLYLPFVGYVPINNEYFQSGKLSVTYRFNVLDGSFVCFVVSTSSKSKLKDSVIGTYSGNCCVHVPISASSFSNIISGLIGGASQISGVTRSIDKEHKKPSDLSGAASAALSVASEKPQLLMNNGYTATSSYLGIRQPYLIIERPVAVYPKDYRSNYGFPSFITKKLGDCTGYTKCDLTHFKTFKNLPSYADDRDLEEIKSMLNDYIIL